MSKFVISLDFELFWGVFDTQTFANYGNNVQGEWGAVPKLLALFRKYGIKVTWATVGMAMCRNYRQWRDLRPSVLPGYARHGLSSYCLEKFVREKPNLFFARPLVEQILDTPGQELATHTYSHFYVSEKGATLEQFAADLACAKIIAKEVGVHCSSLVFPRNQIVEEFVAVLPKAGIQVYRGNADHWLYRNGDAVAGGIAGRALRFTDAFLPWSGKRVTQVERHGDLVNLPASLFLYPWSDRHGALTPMRLFRLKQCMSTAARTGRICHLWWHPHNFGVNTEKNLALLELLLLHYRMLADKYGMQSSCMGDFAIADRSTFELQSQPFSHTKKMGSVTSFPGGLP